MGNQASAHKQAPHPQDGDRESGRTAPQVTDERLVALRALIEKANKAAGEEARAQCIAAVYERLLEPDIEALLWRNARLRTVAVTKAYEFDDHPALAFVTQQFLMKFYPETYGLPRPEWAAADAEDGTPGEEGWRADWDEDPDSQDLDPADEESEGERDGQTQTPASGEKSTRPGSGEESPGHRG